MTAQQGTEETQGTTWEVQPEKTVSLMESRPLLMMVGGIWLLCCWEVLGHCYRTRDPQHSCVPTWYPTARPALCVVPSGTSSLSPMCVPVARLEVHLLAPPFPLVSVHTQQRPVLVNSELSLCLLPGSPLTVPSSHCLCSHFCFVCDRISCVSASISRVLELQAQSAC